jgi:hypothetical protein
VLLVAVVLRVRATSGSESSIAEGRLLVRAPDAFLAGLLSFLSPCCLPVLSAYVGDDHRVLRGATTIVVLGATATALSQLLFRVLPELTTVGGLLIIGFGVMSLLDKGFDGIQLGGGPRAVEGDTPSNASNQNTRLSYVDERFRQCSRCRPERLNVISEGIEQNRQRLSITRTKRLIADALAYRGQCLNLLTGSPDHQLNPLDLIGH